MYMYIQSTFTVLRGIISCPLSESLVGKILCITCRYQFTEYRGDYVRPKHGQHILPLNPSRILGEMIHAQGCIEVSLFRKIMDAQPQNLSRVFVLHILPGCLVITEEISLIIQTVYNFGIQLKQISSCSLQCFRLGFLLRHSMHQYFTHIKAQSYTNLLPEVLQVLHRRSPVLY